MLNYMSKRWYQERLSNFEYADSILHFQNEYAVQNLTFNDAKFWKECHEDFVNVYEISPFQYLSNTLS